MEMMAVIVFRRSCQLHSHKKNEGLLLVSSEGITRVLLG
jgi:hypothetical protein